MAPIAQPPAADGGYNGTSPRFESLQAWLKIYGRSEFSIFKRDNAPTHMSYETWAGSAHVLGPYLYHATLDIWEEESSSDDGTKLDGTELVTPIPVRPKPKTKSTVDGIGMRNAAKPPRSIPHKNSDELDGSAKRKRKPKKKYLSQEIVASGDSDGPEEQAPLVDVATSAAPSSTAAANGQRKTGGRKKKHFVSEEIIPPEDEEDEPMSVDRGALAAIDVQEPTTSAEYYTPMQTTSAGIPKTKSTRKSRKKYLSQEIVPLGDDEDFAPGVVATPNTVVTSPDGPGTSSASRRGLRIRTPAQQRPYQHHARLFEDAISVEGEPDRNNLGSPEAKATRLAQISYPDVEDKRYDGAEIFLNEDEDGADMLPEEALKERPNGGRRISYKGKGRAWRKTEEDEDEDFVSPAKTKGPNQPKRKLGRPKSTQLFQARVREDVKVEVEVQHGVDGKQPSPPVKQSSTPKARKPKRKPRRIHHLSEEFIKDTSETEAEEQREHMQGQQEDTATSRPAPKTAEPKADPRRSDQSITSRSMIDVDQEETLTPSYEKLTTQYDEASESNSPPGRTFKGKDNITKHSEDQQMPFDSLLLARNSVQPLET